MSLNRSGSMADSIVGGIMKVLSLFATSFVQILWLSVQCQAATELSQWAPLNASRLSTFGENPIEGEVHRSLQRLPYFGVFDYLAYTVEGSTVLLYGKVMDPNLRDSAAAVAATAQGVTCVIDKIELLQNSPSDNRIRLDVFGAIYSDPLLLRYAFAGTGGAIHIVVERGRVTLEGEVASVSDARRIAERVDKVSGVASISNHLVMGN
jgi:hypothetical protein